MEDQRSNIKTLCVYERGENMHKHKGIIKKILLSGILIGIALSQSSTIFANPNFNLNYTSGNGKIDLTWQNPYGDDIYYPYAYKLNRSIDGGQSYNTVSMWTENDEVKVLNIYPQTGIYVTFNYKDGTSAVLSKSAAMKVWMEGGTMNEAGVVTSFDNYGRDITSGRQLIDVTPVTYGDFSANPDGYLKDANGNYKYDVIAFGTWDGNNYIDLSQAGADAAAKFIESGRGVFFGHDTLYHGTSPIAFETLRKYLNITYKDTDQYSGEIGSEFGRGAIEWDRYSKVKITSNSPLTTYPWNIGGVGTELTVPAAHNLQVTSSQILMRFTHPAYSASDYTNNENFFLALHNNAAMSQTGHSNANSTEDERKILANTLFYLKQVSTSTHAADADVVDQVAPTSLSASTVACGTTDQYQKVVKLNATDQGSVYKYYLEGIPQIAGHGTELRSNVIDAQAIAGVDSYWYTINNSPTAISKPSATAAGWQKANTGTSYQFTTPNLDTTKASYVHYFAKDKAGNVSSESIYTIANTAPVISIGAKTFYEGQYTQAQWNQTIRDAGLSATDKEDGVITKNVSLVSDRVNINKAGTYTVSYKVKDSGCITTTKNNTITVKYNNPPVITAKDQTFYENQYTKDQWIKQLQKKGVTASDVEDGTITNKIKVIEDNVNPKTPGTYKVTYEVTDKYQKTTTKSVKVTVKFNNPPVITAPAKSFYESELSKSEWEKLRIKDVVASDVEDGKISKIDIVQDDVILDQSGVYNVVYRTTDQWGKSTEQTAKITVKYNNPPMITAKAQTFYEGQYTESYWKNTLRMKDVVASDTEDGNITNKIEIIEDNVNVKVPGVYNVKYKVTDAFGKSTEKQISVTVKFNNPPIIEKESINIHEGEYNEKELEKLLIEDAASEDVEDGTITDKIKIIKNDVNPSKPGSYEVTYEVTDAFGKTTIKTIDVNVIENQQPTLQIFAPSKRFIEGSITVEQWHKERMNKVTAHDREDNDLTNQITVIKDTTNVGKAGEYEVTYKVTDKWNKSTEKIAKVTVEPNEAPVIYASDKWFKTTDTVDQRVILSNVFAFDDHDGELTNEVVIASSEVQSGVAGEYKVTYKVQDRFGKQTAKQVTIHIEDYGSTPIPPKPPIITDPEALQLWNGRELAEINITKLMEDSIFNHSDAYQDVVFGVFAAEDVVYKGKVVITKDSMIAISKIDTSGQVYTKLYHKGKYYLQELATDHHYQLDKNKYYFDFQ